MKENNSSRPSSQATRQPYAKPRLQRVRLRTGNRQLARVDAINHCTAHIHDDANKSPCKF